MCCTCMRRVNRTSVHNLKRGHTAKISGIRIRVIQPYFRPSSGQPPGQGDNLPSGTGNQPLSSQQRTSLKLNDGLRPQAAKAELWAVSGAILVCRRFRCSRRVPAAEHRRNVCWPRPFCPPAFGVREYLRLGNNRQAVLSVITLVRRR